VFVLVGAQNVHRVFLMSFGAMMVAVLKGSGTATWSWIALGRRMRKTVQIGVSVILFCLFQVLFYLLALNLVNVMFCNVVCLISLFVGLAFFLYLVQSQNNEFIWGMF